MALRASYYGIKRQLKQKLTDIAKAWDGVVNTIDTVKAEQRLYGSYNLFNTTASTSTSHNITATVNANKTVTISGGASDAEVLFEVGTFTAKANESYTLTGCPAGGGEAATNYWLALYDGSTVKARDKGEGVTFFFTEDTTLILKIRIPNAYTAPTSGLTFKPMINYVVPTAGIDYMPFSLTNRELTKLVAADSRELLWTNPDPSQTFGPQAITVTIPDYEYYIMETQNKTTSTTHTSNIILEKNVAYGCISLFGGKATTRPITLTNSSISCGDAGNTESDNTLVIPKRLFGVRKLSTVTALRSLQQVNNQRSLQDITPEEDPEPATKKRTTKKTTVKEGE